MMDWTPIIIFGYPAKNTDILFHDGEYVQFGYYDGNHFYAYQKHQYDNAYRYIGVTHWAYKPDV